MHIFNITVAPRLLLLLKLFVNNCFDTFTYIELSGVDLSFYCNLYFSPQELSQYITIYRYIISLI